MEYVCLVLSYWDVAELKAFCLMQKYPPELDSERAKSVKPLFLTNIWPHLGRISPLLLARLAALS